MAPWPGPDPHALDPDVVAAARAALDEGHLFRYDSSSPAASSASCFEREFADFLGSRYAVAVNSCSSAIFLALTSCGVRPGDEVLIPAFTFVAVPSAVVHAGAHPGAGGVDGRSGHRHRRPATQDHAAHVRPAALVHARLRPGPRTSDGDLLRTAACRWSRTSPTGSAWVGRRPPRPLRACRGLQLPVAQAPRRWRGGHGRHRRPRGGATGAGAVGLLRRQLEAALPRRRGPRVARGARALPPRLWHADVQPDCRPAPAAAPAASSRSSSASAPGSARWPTAWPDARSACPSRRTG